MCAVQGWGQEPKAAPPWTQLLAYEVGIRQDKGCDQTSCLFHLSFPVLSEQLT